MRLARVVLEQFRNYEQLVHEPAAGLNVFVGANAQGKTNLLEAICLLATGKSFRARREAELIRHGSERARAEGTARIRAGEVTLQCIVEATASGARKRYERNGLPVRYAGFLGNLRVVRFIPADLRLVDGAPALRRAFLNEALAQQETAYYRALARYNTTLEQKAAMLRGTVSYDGTLMEIYDGTLAAAGATLRAARLRFTRDVAERAAEVHRRWSAGERLEIRYLPNPPGEVDDAASLFAQLRAVAEHERRRGRPLVGPHRDDLAFLLDGRPLLSFGSQGQRRTAVLALKTAEYTVIRERTGEAPLFILDDVLSELDESRARAFLRDMGEVEQAFVTAVALPRGLEPARADAVEGGRLRPLAAG